MNGSTSFIIFGILAFIVILTTCVLAYEWARASSKPITINDSLIGYYAFNGVNQRCVLNSSGPQSTTLLPTYDTPAPCAEDSICVSNNNPDDPYGYCKKKLGTPCNLVFECAPSTDPSKQVYCNNVCSETEFGNLFSTCNYDTPCNAGLLCSNTIDFSSNIGECLLEDSKVCTFDEQCYGGKCDIQGNAKTGVCISRIPAGYDCDVDYCEEGFGCDFSATPIYRHCQPLINDIITKTSTPAQYGLEGSLCKVTPIGLLGNIYECRKDLGYSCNINHTTNSPFPYPSSVYPNLESFGICQKQSSTINNFCSSNNNCFAPSVCVIDPITNEGVCTEPNYLIYDSGPVQVKDVNFCGGTYNNTVLGASGANLVNGSSGYCDEEYSCVRNPAVTLYDDDISLNRFCVGKNTNGLCNSSASNYGGYCINPTSGQAVQGFCTQRKFGVFLSNNPGSYLGTWKFFELPDQSVILNQVNPQSKFSVFEYMPLPSANYPSFAMLKVIFYPNNGKTASGKIFFYYAEFSTYYLQNDNIPPNPPFTVPWKKIVINNYNPLPGPVIPPDTFYINNPSSSLTYTSDPAPPSPDPNTVYGLSYTKMAYQLVGGGGGGGGGNDTGSNRGAGGGGSGGIIGCLGSSSNIVGSVTYNYDFAVSRPAFEYDLLPTSFKVTVSLGAGGAGGGHNSDGSNGSSSTIEIFDLSISSTIPQTTISAPGGEAGTAGDNDNNGRGGSGYNGGGGGNNSTASSANKGAGGATTGPNEGGVSGGDGNDNNGITGGTGGGTGGGIGGNEDSTLYYTVGGGGGAGPCVTISGASQTRTGGDGSGNGNPPDYINAYPYSGAGGGGGSYHDGYQNGGNGATGYSILEFYTEITYQIKELYDIKFSSSGSIALFLQENGPMIFPFVKGVDNSGSPTTADYTRIYLTNDLDLNLGTLNYTSSVYGPMFTSFDSSPVSIIDFPNMVFNNPNSYYNSNSFVWDVDDVYNNSIIVGFIKPGNITKFVFCYNTIPLAGLNDLTELLQTSDEIDLSSSSVPSYIPPSYVKYYTDPKNGPNLENYSYTQYNGNFVIPSTLYHPSSLKIIDFELDSVNNYAGGVATVFNKTYSILRFNLYYLDKSGQIRIISATRTQDKVTSDYIFNYVENQIIGYAPVEIVDIDLTSDPTNIPILSVGNNTNFLYSLMQTCT